MSTTYAAGRLRQTVAPTSRVIRLVQSCHESFDEWRRRQRLRATLFNLSAKELMDIGTTRGEIEYVASNRDTDPRGI